MVAPAPAAGPRNLAPHVAAWLRTLGFTATEHEHPSLTTVAGHWEAPNGWGFYVDYTWWPASKATFQLARYSPDEVGLHVLVKSQLVGRMNEVRPLLLNDECFREVRQAAKATATCSL